MLSALHTPSQPGAMSKPGKSNTALSKQMAYILRHNPPKEMGPGGFVPLPVLLQLLGPAATEETVRQIVAVDSKGRYQIDDTASPPGVRAVQGHSVEVEGLALAPVTSAAALPGGAVHVTSEEGWRLIQESGELRRMTRTHIHFATAAHHMRANNWATVLLQLDIPAALAAGHQLFLAANGVLLTEGPLPVRFVRRVARSDLPPAWQPQQGRHRR